MTNKDTSTVFTVELGERAVAMMINGTADSLFQLERGIPDTKGARIEDYLWSDVYTDGFPVQMQFRKTNPLVIEIPGTYRFRNEGTDDEQALVDVTVFK